MSLKNTVAAAKNIPKPKEKINNSEIITGIKKNSKEKWALVNINTKIKAPKENKKLTKEDKTLAKVKIYLGTYTFFKREALAVIEFKPELVASDIKEKATCPVIR